ncbi:Hsp70 family protein [Actinomycetes bacterium M1A6_2h]
MRTHDSAFGASMGTGCVRGVVTDSYGTVIDSDVRPVHGPSIAATADAAQELAQWYGDEAPVLVVSDHSGNPVADPYVHDGLRMIGEVDAIVAANRSLGIMRSLRELAVVDVGRMGTRVHVVDSYTGEILSTSRTELFGGDVCDLAVVEYLLDTYGAAELLSDGAVAALATEVAAAKEVLSTEASVDVSGPFVTDSVRLRRFVFEDLIGPETGALVALVSAALAAGDVDGVLMVGGGANIASVVRAVMNITDLPVVVPDRPELFAAVGASRLSTVIPVPTVVPAPPAPAAVSHSPRQHAAVSLSSSSKRRRSRIAAYIGTCAVIAVAVVASLTAASARTASVDTMSETASGAPSSIVSTTVPRSALTAMPQAGAAAAESATTTTTDGTTTTTTTTTTTAETTASESADPTTSAADRPDPTTSAQASAAQSVTQPTTTTKRDRDPSSQAPATTTSGPTVSSTRVPTTTTIKMTMPTMTVTVPR